MMNLDIYGGAYRCLLRLRENAGNAVMSEQEFARHYLPGETATADLDRWNESALLQVARALDLADRFDSDTDYEQVLAWHLSGLDVLVRLRGATLDLQSTGPNDFRVTVLATMDATQLTLWCPLRNGAWELLPPLDRARWREVFAVGMALHPLRVPASFANGR